VATDRDGLARPQGDAWDVGAYEMPEGLAGQAGRAGRVGKR